MKLTRNNYEAFFLDYYENNLSPEQVADLMLFLEENSDLKDEFDELEDMVFLSPGETIEFNNKSKLKKKDITPVGIIDSDNYEEFFVAALEGDLTEKESAEVSAFLNKNPDTKLEFNAFRSTFLNPENIVYEDKESLKKKGLFVIYRSQVLYAVSIAASILLFIGLYSLLDKENKPAREYSQINRVGIIKPGVETAVPGKIKIERSTFKTVASNDEDVLLSEREVITISRITPRNISKVEIGESIIAFIDIPGANRTELLADNEMQAAGAPKEKSFMSRFLSSFVKKVIPVNRGNKKSLIEYTVNGYNLIADRDLEVQKQYDSAGNIIAYNVVGDNMEIIKRVKKPVRE